MTDLSDFLSSSIGSINGDSSDHDIQYFARVIKIDASLGKPQLICDDNQPFAFVMGPETVASLVGKTTIEIMDFIGYERSFVKEKIAEGKKFFLVFFRGYRENTNEEELGNGSKTKREPLEATWSNILTLIQDYSPICGSKCASVYSIVQSTPFDSFGCDYDIDKAPPEIYREISSFEAFENTSLPTTPALVRAFLRHTMKCTRLFTGDGYSYDQNGHRGSKEFLIPRARIDMLYGASEVFSLDIDSALL